MILTGKAKKDFDNWTKEVHDLCFNQTGKRLFYIESLDDYKMINTEHYIENVGLSMLYALITEWLDSVGVYISINYVSFYNELRNTKGFEPYVTNNGISTKFRALDSRQEATKQAIIKANEIYNDLNK